MSQSDRFILDRNLGFLKVTVMDVQAKSDQADRALLQRYRSMMQGFKPPRNPGLVGIFLRGLLNEAMAKRPDHDSAKPHVVLTYPGDWNEEELEYFKSEAEAGILEQVCQSCGISYRSEQEAAMYAILWNYHQELKSIRKARAGLRDVTSIGNCGLDYECKWLTYP